MEYKATEIARFVVKISKAYGDKITHLKLQKILYYIQGAYLALKNQPAFSDEILAWKLGPAVISVYSEYKQYGKKAIPYNSGAIEISPEDQKFIEEIYKRYRGYTAGQLVDKTHREAPWESTADSDVISNDSIKEYFSSTVYNESNLFLDREIITVLPTEWYDLTEDEEWSKYR